MLIATAMSPPIPTHRPMHDQHLEADDSAMLREIRDKVTSIESELLGKPGDRGSGLVMRVDRLEQERKKLKFIVGAASASAIAAAIATVWQKLTGTPPPGH